jgi:hypothetical protein
MVRSLDALPDDAPLWSAEDRDWATRLARESCGEGAPLPKFVAERARHAWHKLSARESGLGRWATQRGWRTAWLVIAAAVGALFGLGLDHLGSAQRINLLAVQVWAVVAWNLIVVGWVLVQSLRLARASPDRPSRLPGALRRALARRLSGSAQDLPAASPAAAGAAAWTMQAVPLTSARVAALFHTAAAALALGMVASLYLRGLVLDYRVGWQSTFLEAATVQAVLDGLLAPASVLGGVAVPAVDALRIRAGEVPTGAAAPWLHLSALTLLLFAVLPRALLAALSLGRAARLARDLPLPWHEAYFQQLARLQADAQARIQVCPHGAAPTGAAVQTLRARLASKWGSTLQLDIEAPVAVGDEDRASSTDLASISPTLRVAWFDLTATPEAETQGRWVQVLQARQPVAPLVVVVDETAFAVRFGAYPARLVQRREAWSGWARGLGTDLEFLSPAGKL